MSYERKKGPPPRDCIKFLQLAWARLNAEAFGSRFDTVPRFEIPPYKPPRLGRFIPGLDRHTIRISRLFFQGEPGYSFEELLVTLGHEMIHAKQFDLGLPLEHDDAFEQMSRQIGMW